MDEEMKIFALLLACIASSAFFVGLGVGAFIKPAYVPPTDIPKVELYGPVHAFTLAWKAPPAEEIEFRDCYYYLITLDDMRKLLEWDKTDQREWVAEEYDCDDFAYDLWRNIARHYHIALGVIGVELPDGTLHMMNIFFSAEGQVYVIEPQTDEIIPISEFDGVILDVEM